MSLASLFNVPGSDEELSEWSFSHQAHHRDVNQQIYNLGGGNVIEYILDPLNPYDVGTWTYQHQDWHNRVNEILGLSGYDLTGVEFRDPAQSSGWIWLNSDEHRRWSDLLGVG